MLKVILLPAKVPATLFTGYLREYHLFVNELPLFILLLWICHNPGESALQWEVCKLWLCITEPSVGFCVDSSAKLTLTGRTLTFACPTMSPGSPWSYLLLMASARIPCHCEFRRENKIHSLSFFLVQLYVPEKPCSSLCFFL